MIVDQHLPLADIHLDDGLQVRATISDAVVADYAERMTEGAVFPPVVVFLIDGILLLADGYHRFRAAERIGLQTLVAEVRHGSRTDALWFALGANRLNGQRLNLADKTHAVALAMATWPTKTNREIAAQVGCSPSLVSKVVAQDTAKNTGGAPALRGLALVHKTKRDAAREMVVAGHQSIEIQKAIGVHSSVIADIRRELGLSRIDYSRKAVKARYAEMRKLAIAGHTSQQIAAVLGVSAERCRKILRLAEIVVPGDDVTRGLHHHNSTRIMERIVADAANLAAGANLIDFSALDRAQFADWMETFRQARSTLGTFIKRLTQEQSHHGEAA